jgi:hypothetical protein
MNRRNFIAAIVAGSFTGCLGTSQPETEESGANLESTATVTSTSTPEQSTTQTPTSVETLEIDVGEAAVIGGLTTVQVDSLGSSEELRFEDGRRLSAKEGTFYVLAKVIAKGYNGNRVGAFPGIDWFEVTERDNTVIAETEFINWGNRSPLTHPVSEPLYVGGAVGSSREWSVGWLVFTLSETSSTQIEVQLTVPDYDTPSVAWRGEIHKP